MAHSDDQDEREGRVVREDDDRAATALPRLIPLAFLGLGLYRAWIEIVFVGSFVPFPGSSLMLRDVFDWAMVAVSFG